MTYETNCLIHYGIPHQKWGVRRFQNPDGSLTEAGKKRYAVDSGGNKKFEKKLRKDVKSMQKALDKTDIELQKERAAKYDSRAKKFAKVGAAAAAAGLVTSFAAEGDRRNANTKIKEFKDIEDSWKNDADYWRKQSGWALNSNGNYEKTVSPGIKIVNSAKEMQEMIDWCVSKELLSRFKREDVEDRLYDLNQKLPTVQAVALGTAAGAYGLAGYNKIKSAVAKSRTTASGHAKAVAKAREKYDKMVKTYENTPLLSVFKTQIETYKKLHPNTELSDKEIMNNMI